MFLYILLIAGAIWLDQLTKWLAVTFLRGSESFVIWDGVLQLTYLENRGAAFGMLQNSRWLFLIVSAVAVVAMTVFLWYRRKSLHPLVGLGIALMTAGGAGNMIDRVMLGYVVDFVDFTLINFAIFNFADMCVTIGAGFLIAWVLFVDLPKARKDAKKARENPEADSASVNQPDSGAEDK